MCEVLQNMRRTQKTMSKLLKQVADTVSKFDQAGAPTAKTDMTRQQRDAKTSIFNVSGPAGKEWVLRAVAHLYTTGKSMLRRDVIRCAWGMYLENHSAEKARLTEVHLDIIACCNTTYMSGYTRRHTKVLHQSRKTNQEEMQRGEP